MGHCVSNRAGRQGRNPFAGGRLQRGRRQCSDLNLRPAPSARRGIGPGDRGGFPGAWRGDYRADPPRSRERKRGGEAPCRRWREARELARKGLPIYTNLCQRKSDGQSSQCPYFTGCEYIQTRREAYCSPFVILVHSHLGLEWGATAAERFYAEEDEGTGRSANATSTRSRPTSSSVMRTRPPAWWSKGS